jgi:endoribonuclease Dicer
MSTQEKARGKIIVFFVPKVSLVEQQARYIEKETGLRVDRLHGALALKFSDRQGWKKKLGSHDVVVITGKLSDGY